MDFIRLAIHQQFFTIGTSGLDTKFSKFLHRTFKYIFGHQVPQVFEINACKGGTEGPGARFIKTGSYEHSYAFALTISEHSYGCF